MSPGFLLSHHSEEELHRCYRFGSVHVCARCLGVYPVLFGLVAIQLVLHAPLALKYDFPLVLGLTAPAVLDWALGQRDPARGSNLFRTFTGALLGLGLGRSLYIHLVSPFPKVLLFQLALVSVVVPPVILATYWRKRRG